MAFTRPGAECADILSFVAWREIIMPTVDFLFLLQVETFQTIYMTFDILVLVMILYLYIKYISKSQRDKVPPPHRAE